MTPPADDELTPPGAAHDDEVTPPGTAEDTGGVRDADFGAPDMNPPGAAEDMDRAQEDDCGAPSVGSAPPPPSLDPATCSLPPPSQGSGSGREPPPVDSGTCTPPPLSPDSANCTLLQGEPLRPFCRICFEGEGAEPLIAPCRCRGTQKYVHRTCLDSWRAAREGFAFAHCTECKAAFVLRVQQPGDRPWRKLQYRACVALDHVLLFLLVQLLVAVLGTLIYSAFGDELIDQLGFRGRPGSFFVLAVVVSVSVGVLYGFFMAIIFSEHIEKRHLHVLQRKPLTQEYLVEDLEAAMDSLDNLRPEHEQELVTLGLLPNK